MRSIRVLDVDHMQNCVRRHKLLAIDTAAVCAILCSVLWSATGSFRGGLVARYDISRGNYEVLGYGLPVAWRPEYARLLAQRYGVRFHSVAGCVVSPGLVAYVDAYDKASASAINQKFGHDIFEECSREARENWQQSRKLAKK
jgi:hypothetical protein